MVTIRPALRGDLELLWPLVRRAVAHMNELGNPQWGGDYPTRDHYAGDLERGELYLAHGLDGVLAGAVCLNTAESPEYAALPWSVPGPALVIHRMVVDPCRQRLGTGRALFAYAEALARKNGVQTLRVDTYARNQAMRALIEACGFRQVGLVHFDRVDRPLGFPCFEKVLTGLQPHRAGS